MRVKDNEAMAVYGLKYSMLVTRFAFRLLFQDLPLKPVINNDLL